MTIGLQACLLTCKLTPPTPFVLAGLAPPLAMAVLAVPLEPTLPGLRMPPPMGSELGRVNSMLLPSLFVDRDNLIHHRSFIG